jgi:putative membrane protein insertion efficiency factor
MQPMNKVYKSNNPANTTKKEHLPLSTSIGLLPIKIYRLLRAGRPSPCRYIPSCSEYGVEAITRFGVLRGWWMAILRVTRCRPGGGFGFDPVPDKD